MSVSIGALQGLRSRWSALLALPLRAPLPPGGGGGSKKGKDKGPRVVGELSREVVTGCGLLKNEADPPIKPDAEYPAWLFKMLDPRPTIKELEKAYTGGGLTIPELRRLWRLKNKARIKESNFLKAKS
ncbi:hypothetical protein HYH02_008443 [Chlamydomonas schloesseri]|uniref:Large ribosomal subunit protein mL54 n=1 Tax=Chlamydomonas schloesseri TaxID=2026947 RepID=A0A836B3A6_9CHLO|nr:hypothetical protein HYH02_008443 [Chlamydomonas schloesseri]|eukprot:KAG2446451.1 hypothetical protein HYH02_008443 [Chlamydomonas schloesseri]